MYLLQILLARNSISWYNYADYIWYVLFTLGNWYRIITQPDVKNYVHDVEVNWWRVAQWAFLGGETNEDTKKLELYVHLLEFLNVTSPKKEREIPHKRLDLRSSFYPWRISFECEATLLLPGYREIVKTFYISQ